MIKINVIVAIAQNNAIGKDNDIPWKIKEDFQHFKEKTMGFPCIMGDKTFESLPDNAKPLPGRENIVLSFDKDYKPEGAIVFNDFNEAIDYVKNKDIEKAFVIGGATIYKLGMQIADTLELTKIHKDYEADIFFPEINFNEWILVNKEDKEGIDVKSGENVRFSFLTYKRNQNENK
jgi:dihydrofolate reductase